MAVHFTEERVEPYRSDRPGIPSRSRYVTCLTPLMLSSSSLDSSNWQVATLSRDLLLQCFCFTTDVQAGSVPFPLKYVTPGILSRNSKATQLQFPWLTLPWEVQLRLSESPARSSGLRVAEVVGIGSLLSFKSTVLPQCH